MRIDEFALLARDALGNDAVVCREDIAWPDECCSRTFIVGVRGHDPHAWKVLGRSPDPVVAIADAVKHLHHRGGVR